jgi:alcohol dehydrogenase, propanol-preferring
MRAMVLERQREPLKPMDIPTPHPSATQVRIRVQACALCRTDLHVVDGELTNPKLPLVPGHQIVGVIDEIGSEVAEAGDLVPGDRVGVPWLGEACGHCRYCLAGQENLCDHAIYTGYQRDGGFAELCVADARFCLRLPKAKPATAVAPWLCAGLIGYRALRMAGPAQQLGFYGFGAAAHLLIQVAGQRGQHVHAFTRAHDQASQAFARQLGAVWAGSSDDKPPTELDAALIFAPAGELVPRALAAVRKGGTVVCAGIHMSDIPSFPYALLWGERTVRSVANLTRQDGIDFLSLAHAITIEAETTAFPLEQANQALEALRTGALQGAAVLSIS